MKAILLEQPGKFEQIEIAEPSQPTAGEALVRVHRVGICGTDISGYLGKMPFYSYPRIPGHELGVEVLEVGPGVTQVKPGDRCSVEPYMNCQQCFACRNGGGNCCEKLQVLGVHTDGGLRPQFIVPARKLHRSTKLSLDQLALVETLAIGCHAVDRSGAKAGDNVLVIGAGPIGLATLGVRQAQRHAHDRAGHERPAAGVLPQRRWASSIPCSLKATGRKSASSNRSPTARCPPW